MSNGLLVKFDLVCQAALPVMQKVNLNDIPWRERKSPKAHYHRFLRDVALAFQNPKSGPKPRREPPFEEFSISQPRDGMGILSGGLRGREGSRGQEHART